MLVLAALAATHWSWVPGFGEPQNDAALASSWVYPLLAFAVNGYAVSAFVAEWLSRPASGLNAGTYLFATHSVQVDGSEIIIQRLEELSELNAKPVSGDIVFQLNFPQEAVRLAMARSPENERRLAAWASMLRAAALAHRRGDREWLASRNPIGEVDLGRSPAAGVVSPIRSLARPLCVAGGVALAVVLTPIRTLASDVVVVQTISKNPSSRAWRWYIERGGARAEEARVTWLPAAERAEDEAAFQAAVTAGTSQGFRDYLVKFSLHADKVRAKDLPEAALREAIASGSITKLRSFQAEFSAAGHAAYREDADREVSHRYAEALEKLKSQLPPKDRALHRYFERLFAWLASSPDGRVDVVFSPPATANLAAIDALYRRVYASSCGSVASLETNFGASAMEGSQVKVFDGLTRSFQQIVSNEALTLVQSETGTDERPLFRVAYTITSSGTVFVDNDESTSKRASECFVGTRIKFDVRMTIPGEKTRYAFSVNVVPPDHFEVSNQTASWMPSRSGVAANRVYDVMTGLAFERLADGLRTRLFAPSSSAYDEMFDMLDAVSR
jgi:hypothetical protein